MLYILLAFQERSGKGTLRGYGVGSDSHTEYF